jgi:glycosyltransferase involved in cell wall biosynthesis
VTVRCRPRGTGGSVEAIWPIRVEVVDAEADLPVISRERAAGRPYVGAWVVVRRDGVPRGTLELPFGADGLVDPSRLRALVAGFAPPPQQATSDRLASPDPLPSITVIIPTNLARPGSLLPTLASLSKASYPDLEILVVDNRPSGGGDPLPDILKAYPEVRWVHQPVRGVDAARNAGLVAARGEVVAFTDDDVEVDPEWLPALGRRFASHPEEDAVCGLILPLELETLAQVWFERYYGGFGAIRRYEPMSFASRVSPRGSRQRWRVVATNCRSDVVRAFPVYGAGAIGAGANMAFRAEAINAIGGFDTTLGAGAPSRGAGDIAAYMTLLWEGRRIGFEPAAVVFHQHRRSTADFRAQLHSYGIAYTAILTSLIRHDHRHAAAIARQLPGALRRFLSRARGPVRRASPDSQGTAGRAYPRHLRLLELTGNVRGPISYVTTGRKARRWAG